MLYCIEQLLAEVLKKELYYSVLFTYLKFIFKTINKKDYKLIGLGTAK